MVHALLSFSLFARQNNCISANFAQSAADLFKDLGKAIIKNSRSLDILSHIQYHQKIETQS